MDLQRPIMMTGSEPMATETSRDDRRPGKEPKVLPTFQCTQFAVFDDVLRPDESADLRRFIEFASFKPVNPGVPYSPWHITDGQPLKGSSAVLTAEQTGSVVAPDPPTGGAMYPTGTPLDHVLGTLAALSPGLERWIGVPGTDWVVCTATPWVYPAGSGLSWHSDGAGYPGAYIYYAHPEWDVHWGGELMIADAPSRLTYPSSDSLPAFTAEERTAYRFDKREMNEHLLRSGLARVVMAKPSRLVVLQGGNPHKISRVDACAAITSGPA